MNNSMLWLIIPIFVLIFGFLLYPRMKIPRDPTREGSETEESIKAYDLIGNWLIFKLERKIVVDALQNTNIKGFVVDVGCGPGYLLSDLARRFSNGRIIGLDISDGMLRRAKNNWPVEDLQNLVLLRGDVHGLPLLDSSVDFIVSSLSLHHWSNRNRAFKEIKRVLKPGGGFLIMDLRRDSRRIYYYMLMIGQLFAPRAIRQTNGAIGSFWSSYTPKEVEVLISENFPLNHRIRLQPGWMLISGNKSKGNRS
jgi:ubiquinone/menaquinone biosynthesis C-methylase UbiE